MYRMGWPGWELMAKIGVPTYMKLYVVHDVEAGVYVATSRNLDGLVVEVSDKATAQDFHREVDNCIALLLADKPQPVKTVTVWPVETVPA